MSTTFFDLPRRSWFFTLRSFLVLILFLGTNAAQAQLPFVTTWQTTTDGESITIPTIETGYSYTVDWGDGGTDETVYTGDATHIYAAAGTYIVSIYGDFPRIYFNYSGDREKILSIEQWGDQVWTNMRSAFHGCNNLTYGATDVPNLSSVTGMSRMFSGCISFNGDLSSWDVSNVTDMSNMFYGCTLFNGDLSNWDVSNVNDMSRMFSGCISFNGDLSSWDVSNVTDMSSMFSGCISFKGDLSSWDVSNVNDMSWMFYDCIAFNQALSNWDVSNVNDMRIMFYRCIAFNQDLSNWDVSNVNDMSSMFYECTLFNGDLSNWDVSNVNDMSWMFIRCILFNSGLSNWDVSNVTDMSNMFSECTLFNGDLSNWDVSNVNDMRRMFYRCHVFNQDLSGWDVSNVTDMSWMFYGCTLFSSNLSSWNISNVTDMSVMLTLSGLSVTYYDRILNEWSQLDGLSSSVTLGAVGLQYCSSESAKDILIDDFGWVINDSGQNCLSDSSISITADENNNTGLAIAVLSAFGEINDFEFTTGDSSNDQDNDVFTIEAGELYSTIAFDYEVKSQYFLYIRETDREGYYLEKEITVIINDVNETPILNDTIFEITSRISEGTTVAKLEATDPEEDAVTYSIISGNTDDAFTIDDQGKLLVASETALDQGEDMSFVITIEASDGDLSSAAEVTVNVEYVILSTAFLETSTSIYPNPVRNQLQISTREINLSKSKIQIIDLTGQEIMKLEAVETIDVSSLKSGIYMLRLIDGLQVSDTRFMKY